MANRTYDDALDCLNSLQTKFKTLHERRAAGVVPGPPHYENTLHALDRLGYKVCTLPLPTFPNPILTLPQPHDLDCLNIIHVAGTKGKGTTSAYAESILAAYQRSHGLPSKIGLFTSPHLVSVRERIRINSLPITTEKFTKYFFDVWDRLDLYNAKEGLGAMDKPPYFRFLTLMSFHAFVCEGVDAAVYEVGLGGEYDATNVIAQPAATGISTLGIDHVDILGHTIEEIAWHKAGILKHGSPAFSVEQLPAAAAVVAQRAKEKDARVEIVHVDPRLKDVRITPDAKFQKQNASLAISLTETVMKRLEPDFKLPPDTLPKEFVDGLEQVVLRGRCETKVESNIRWFIDGAHTADSLKVSAQWFGGESAKHAAGKRVLIFNQQGREEAVELLEGLYNGIAEQGLVKFDHVVFCTNITYAEGYKKDFVNVMYDPAAIKGMTMQKAFKEKWEKMDPAATVMLSETIEGALGHVRELADQGGEVQALVTGSLHLVGGALGVLEGGDAL
ncbi:hypothetical protein V502_02562 [Pseudogymnoascus sp. VKM F-4520 (FW-2644)]|nr:hypothetical protein V502_02562 [Pseudogymnoascus sp. VKM F-4520 (FW-2644)]